MWGIELVDSGKETLTIDNVKAASSPRHSISSTTSTEEEIAIIGTDQANDDSKKGKLCKL